MSLVRPVNPLCLVLVCWLVAIGSPEAAVAAKVTPLPQSDYAVRSACAAPAPGRAACLALNLQPRTAAARARAHSLATRSAPHPGLAKASECALGYPSSCLTPQDLRGAYFPGEEAQAPATEPQTIALVDAYNDPSAEADLSVYSSEFGLPACTKANGCFKQMSQSGDEAPSSLPFPRTKAELEEFAKGTARQPEEAEEAEGWALEIATDVEVAHAVCNNCHILLVEASSPEYSALEAAEDTAALHAQEISNSWGGQEGGGDSPAFDHPGVVITAAAGDDGYMNWDQYASRDEFGSPYFQGADYPAASAARDQRRRHTPEPRRRRNLGGRVGLELAGRRWLGLQRLAAGARMAAERRGLGAGRLRPTSRKRRRLGRRRPRDGRRRL